MIFDEMLFDEVYWREPLWLLIFILPWMIILLTHYQQKKIWSQVADPHLLPWLSVQSTSSRQNFRRLLLVIAWLLFSLSLAGPRTPQWIPPSLMANDTSVVVIIDFSQSMKAKDGKVDRITQAQRLLRHWLEELSPKLRVGLVVYSGYSHTLLIPTTDKMLLEHFISQLKRFRPPTLGNNLAGALQSAGKQIRDLKGEQHILLLSDGDLGNSALDDSLKAALEITTEPQLFLTVVGIGKDEAVRISVAENKSLVVDGKVIVTRRHIASLKKIAEQADGRYYNIENVKQSQLNQVLDLPKSTIEPKSRQQVLWHEWFFIPLLGGIFLSLLALQISGNKSKKLTLISLVFFLNACHHSDERLMTQNKVNDALNSGDYAGVLNLVKSYEAYDDYLRFSEGVACYRLKDYVCAQQSFAEVAWSSSHQESKARAVFNLANSHFHLGDYEQASVLFNDAEQLGISKSKTGINQKFSDSLAAAVIQRLSDIAKTKQRADWLSSARTLPDGFEDKLAEGIYLTQRSKAKTIPLDANLFSNLSLNEQNLLLEQGIQFINTHSKMQASSLKQSAASLSTQSLDSSWVSSKQKGLPQQTSDLLNDLMSYETGLHYVPDESLSIEGKRSW